MVAATVLTFLALMTGWGCQRDNSPQRVDAYPEGASEVEDSLRVGNLEFATERVRELQRQVKDSDDLMAFVVLESVVDYYSARPDSLLRHTSIAIDWLHSRQSTPRRQSLLVKVLQARAGYFTQYDFNPDSCLHYQAAAYNTAVSMQNPTEEEQTAANLADTYKLRGDLELSSKYYHRALHLADSLGMARSEYVPVTCGLAAVYTALGNYEESARWWEYAGKYWDVMMTHEKFNYLNNTGNDLYLQKKYPESLEVFRKLHKFIIDNGLTEWERHFCEANLSDVMIRMGMDSLAAPYIDQNLRYFKEISPNPYAYNHVLTQAMRLNMNLGRYDEADRLIGEHPLDYNVRNEQQLGRYEFLSEYYTLRGDWKKAYDAGNAFRYLEDSIRNVKIKLSTQELGMRYQRDAEVLTLRNDVEHHRARLLRIYVVVALSVALCALLVVVIVMMRSRARRKESRMLMRIMNLRMDNLRRRITPHFIYNSINHEILAREQGFPDNLDALVYLLRRQQQMAADFTSSIKDEFEFMDDYIRVEAQNVHGGLLYSLTFDVEGDVRGMLKMRLPSMALQILVENAFKHGFPSLPADVARRLEVNVRKNGDAWEVSVFNNCSYVSPRTDDKTREGIRIITQTIALLNEHNSEKMSLDLSVVTDGDTTKGFKAVIKIPDNYDFDIDRYISAKS